MLLRDLLAAVPHRRIRGDDEAEVTGVTHDSRQAGPGTLFVAVRGLRADGLAFAAEAAAKGAAAVVAGQGRAQAVPGAVARVIEVADEREALALLAREFHGRPDESLAVVGVTGTNGKTTTCHILAAMLQAAGRRPGVIGTVGWTDSGMTRPLERTTPEAPDLHRYLARMRDAGLASCVMEVSSHALELKRVHGMRFAAAVFTNLTRDHLDYHGEMERYFEAKASLFEGPARPGVAAINVDDVYGARLADRFAARGGPEARLIRFGRGETADLRMVSFETGTGGTRVSLRYAGKEATLESHLVGEVNAWNVTAAAAAAVGMGLDWAPVAAGALAADRVPGRLERVEAPRSGSRASGITVLVDYAHTDDALRKLLETVRQITPGRVLVVFGCGGDRDRTKRPLMGAHAARLADLVFVTSDNPRSERPESILEEILAGVEQAAPGERAREGGRIRVDADRARSIEAAVRSARKGDTVVIAGKGHETSQLIGDRVTPFDDRLVARRALEALAAEGDAGGGEAADGSH